MKRIPLTQGKFAIVDDADFVFLSQWKWNFGARVYARTSIKGKKVYMHRLINKTPEGFHTDHINRDTLDNRRSNLRTATVTENLLNSKTQRNNTSGHRGVSWNKKNGSRSAYISIRSVQRRRMFLGYFSNLKDAVSARETAFKLHISI